MSTVLVLGDSHTKPPPPSFSPSDWNRGTPIDAWRKAANEFGAEFGYEFAVVNKSVPGGGYAKSKSILLSDSEILRNIDLRTIVVAGGGTNDLDEIARLTYHRNNKYERALDEAVGLMEVPLRTAQVRPISWHQCKYGVIDLGGGRGPKVVQISVKIIMNY